MNTNDEFNSIDKERCNNAWEIFVIAHDREIERLKKQDNKTLRWYVA
jgi:hypothetical protein